MEIEPIEYVLDCERDAATLKKREISDLIFKLYHANNALVKLEDKISWLEELLDNGHTEVIY